VRAAARAAACHATVSTLTRVCLSASAKKSVFLTSFTRMCTATCKPELDEAARPLIAGRRMLELCDNCWCRQLRPCTVSPPFEVSSAACGQAFHATRQHVRSGARRRRRRRRCAYSA
jgi:hypothetical protein